MNLTAIRSLAAAARLAIISTDAAHELHQLVQELNTLVARDPEDIQGLHRRAAREVVALATQLLEGQAPQIGAAAELAAPGGVARLQAQYDALIADARAGL